MTLARRLVKRPLGKISPMLGSRDRCASAASSSDVLRTGVGIASMPSDGAEASAALTNSFPCGEVSGFKTRAIRRSDGAICLSRSAHLPAIENSGLAKPVMFPPGRVRLGMKPCATGAETPANTIGIFSRRNTGARHCRGALGDVIGIGVSTLLMHPDDDKDEEDETMTANRISRRTAIKVAGGAAASLVGLGGYGRSARAQGLDVLKIGVPPFVNQSGIFLAQD